ncbi:MULTISPECIES: ABC transporter ATP-binding protein [Ensifer]|uniref:Sn-glycerol-3-phosphate ABC transporter ATP-binding protein UgpC n=1 Tax=Ensifer adhaerens TaxID=106592 RepID=A0A9Q9DDL7_ENSAD|nr:MULTISPECIES: sn-glycerol-3-phosphate ABC transporter ATP-binding protein UgpC [Ensifer]KQX52595.1 sugar ABC transporter ATP-binding protein [Ensifer sp. Root1298]KQX85422.1 sugar ABC transporter ATP-binding protein [Ensifer sp. Root1312]KRC18934.1 sugar ABC transporter ATP-binding protein [Ensifer sp. Root74]KRD76790.1 sugar ABC transporter ATP-binding protein [Ensifer sp. Root954]USJ27744.1 sn-glycerol-3-phosphate ABC transporter ATP-binding protein UgpC [Ensifer adhaerens]
MANLAINHVTKSFGSLAVLKDIKISIDDGEFLVLVGPSGCGKSTLLSIIAGLEEHTSGTITIDGRPVDGLEPKERDIAMVFQSYALYPAMTVEQNIGFSLEMSKMPKAERVERVGRVADLLQISHLLKRRPGQLSGGQRQRVAMGRALVREPKIFLFDEPLSNLDAKLRVEMRTEIKRLHQRLGATIVYVTHDQIEAMTMATRIAVMKDGVLQQFGTPEDIYDRPANVFVATFMGSPPMNLLPATVVEGASGPWLCLKGADVTLPLPASVTARLVPGSDVLLGLRPEWLSLATEEVSANPMLTLHVDVIEPTGPDVFVALRAGEREIMARLPTGTSIRSGEKRAFALDLSKTVVFDAGTGIAH